MAIFQRENETGAPSGARTPARPAPAAGKGEATTVVAAGSRLQGEISGGTDVVVHGELEGQLTLKSSVVVGESGVVKGRIQARNVRVGGKVYGDIHASERIEVLESGTIEGDVVAPRVAINAGAFFKGKVEMSPQQEERPAAPAKPSPGAAPPRPAAAGAPKTT